MKAKNFLSALIALVVAASFTSCDKDKPEDDNDTSIANDVYSAQKESDDIVMVLGTVAYDNGVARVDEVFVPSGLVTIDTTSTPKSMIVDFGEGFLCDWDNKTRKGEIKVTWTGKYKEPGTTLTVTTTDYYINNTKFEFNKTVHNDGQNAEGHLSYTVNITQCNVIYSDGSTFSMTSNRTREFVEGESTLFFFDDVYNITGNANGTSRSGVPFTWNITNPLEVAIGCQWIQQGTMVITPQGKPSRTLDFGSGNCDSNATVTIDGTVYNINL